VPLLTPTTAYQSPVAKGALFRHTCSTLLDVGTGWSLGVVRDEYFDPKLHPDAYTVRFKRGRSKRKSKGKGKSTIVHDHAVVKKDYTFSGEALVEDRVSYILVRIMLLVLSLSQLTIVGWHEEDCEGHLV